METILGLAECLPRSEYSSVFRWQSYVRSTRSRPDSVGSNSVWSRWKRSCARRTKSGEHERADEHEGCGALFRLVEPRPASSGVELRRREENQRCPT